eukprot:7337205-Prorocentrum_lima.AAC.1
MRVLAPTAAARRSLEESMRQCFRAYQWCPWCVVAAAGTCFGQWASHAAQWSRSRRLGFLRLREGA